MAESKDPTDSPAAAGRVGRTSSAGALPRSVLVVEDDTILALATEDALRAAGIEEVSICNSTAQALEMLREASPEALVLDVHLADRDDGWAIAELVTEMGPNPPRIIFSTGAPRDIPEDIGELGTVLEKPYEPEQLLAALRTKPAGLLARLRGALG